MNKTMTKMMAFEYADFINFLRESEDYDFDEIYDEFRKVVYDIDPDEEEE
tara:strand:- start:110 stop:259 length:150 start_codon:yes stop_codon:yes gene_type:complete